MFLEEKIDQLKQQFRPTEFRVPFSSWVEIMKKIESKFIVKKNSNSHFNFWSSNVKRKIIVKAFPVNNITYVLRRLNMYENYRVVLVHGDEESCKHYVYDCKPEAIEVLVNLTSHDFFVVDKQYRWLTSFEYDQMEEETNIYKSNGIETPFDTL